MEIKLDKNDFLELLKFIRMSKKKRYIIVYVKPGLDPETFGTLTMFCKAKNAPYWQLMRQK